MACADELDGMNIGIGEYVTTKHAKYTIMDLIGKGGYGAVYRVCNEAGKEFALKAEKKVERRERSKLNMELHILGSMEKQAEGKSHYAKIFDRAKKTKFCAIIMTLLGESLSDLKKRNHPPVFKLNTGYAAAIQCLEAIEELHNIGFIHRDIKPGNYAIGLGRMSSLIYILDFGISRRIVNHLGLIKAPREQVPFKGTVRFAAVATHKNLELSYKDDCESWLYMVTDMCNPKGVPWKMEKDKIAVLKSKESARAEDGMKRLFVGMSIEDFGRILSYLASLKYDDTVDYNYIYTAVKRAAREKNLTLLPPYDWDKQRSSSVETSSSDSNMPISKSTK